MKSKLGNIFTLERFTEEIDGYWGKPRFNFYTIRDKTYINWRYFDNPDKYQFLYIKESSIFLGYIVLKLSEDRKIGTICDFITFNDRMDIFSALLWEAEKRLFRNGVDSIRVHCIADSPYYKMLLSHGYMSYKSGFERKVVIYSGTQLGRDTLEEEGNFHLTFSDMDVV